MDEKTLRRLQRLEKRWLRQINIYREASLKKRVDGSMSDLERLDANRYEGIATGFRWALEDLQTAAAGRRPRLDISP